MKSALTAGLLLLCLLTAFVSAADETKKEEGVEVVKLGGNRIELRCPGLSSAKWTHNSNGDDISSILEYKDDSSGEYTCSSGTTAPAGTTNERKIYVKIRTCDNCVELDLSAILGLVVGDLVATAVIGVAVYLIASQARSSAVTSPQKKSSDRQHLVPNEVTGRASNEPYERLRHKAQRDTYDVINKR